ncbi:MAG: substrate-binding domain-containing protein [Oscillospiraceae bacterium]|nr:substrate-binding domain-containing protein [Oscillospiraceae bacterium]
MNKKTFLFLMFIICFINLSGCNKTENYPEITITINNTKIIYYKLPNKWNGNIYDKLSAYQHVFTENPTMENLVEVNTNDIITIDFMENNPDKIKIEYEFITVSYFNDNDNISSEVETFEIMYEINDNKYSFIIDKFDENNYNNWDSKYYELFTPMNSYMINSDKLCYIAGRVYKITASWGENECEYIFLIKNKEDIDKDDIIPADMSPNVNVMLKRPDNWQKIIENPVISENDMLRIIDGSTATIPITAELFRQFYDYTDAKLNEEYIGYTHSTTHYAYINLIERRYGRSDPKYLIFVTPPSTGEVYFAEYLGVELDITPIAKDGFVFITHKENPIESLTVEQIQAIYTGEITNWKELGGEDIEIQAYQREPNSGSQTVMEEMVMQGKQLIKPIDTQVIGGMGWLVDAIAEYKNGKASIGYTYYYYINNLYKNENIKVLKIDGIAPDNENLINETYPFTANYFAVMRGDEPVDSPARKLRDFLITEQGQQLIEMAGYCRIFN